MKRSTLRFGLVGLLCVALVASIAVFTLTARMTAAAQSQQRVQWQPSLRAAHRSAVSTNRPILIVFGASWCYYCKKLEAETLNDPTVSQIINSNFVPLHLYFDKDRRVAEILEVKSLPTAVVLSPNADLLGSIVGYVNTAEMRVSLKDAREFSDSLMREQTQQAQYRR
jgi:thioredoxin-related protein